jgi:hypothetical protein
MKTYQQIEAELRAQVEKACAAYKSAEPADRLAFERGYCFATAVDKAYEVELWKELARERTAKEFEKLLNNRLTAPRDDV